MTEQAKSSIQQPNLRDKAERLLESLWGYVMPIAGSQAETEDVERLVAFAQRHAVLERLEGQAEALESVQQFVMDDDPWYSMQERAKKLRAELAALKRGEKETG